MASVIINYCSNERAFINALLTECLKFSNDIVVSYGSHLYDGTPEDETHISELKEKYNSIQFVRYDVDVSLDLYKQKGVYKRPTAYWHNLARWTGVQELKNKEWVFVIDADEIPEGDLVKQWLQVAELRKTECYKIATFWYFKHPTNQASVLEDSILLIHADYLTEDTLFGDFERDFTISKSKCLLKRLTKGVSNAILWHHYSWVRPKKELTHKIKNWGHSNDMFRNIDADKLVDYIFRDDNVNDVVHGYDYISVINKFNLDTSSYA